MLVLRIGNQAGRSRGGSEGGQGLIGMRERVELYEGTLEYGPTDEGWLVVGTLPLASTPPSTTVKTPEHQLAKAEDG